MGTVQLAGRSDRDSSAFGVTFDFPNDKWDIYASYMKIGEAFEPSLGFVPRRGVRMYSLSMDYMPRPEKIKASDPRYRPTFQVQ